MPGLVAFGNRCGTEFNVTVDCTQYTSPIASEGCVEQDGVKFVDFMKGFCVDDFTVGETSHAYCAPPGGFTYGNPSAYAIKLRRHTTTGLDNPKPHFRMAYETTKEDSSDACAHYEFRWIEDYTEFTQKVCAPHLPLIDGTGVVNSARVPLCPANWDVVDKENIDSSCNSTVTGTQNCLGTKGTCCKAPPSSQEMF